ncbi:DUF5655 domain-containing protein [Nocardioides caricicola]|uniref:DUF5655 domain-containing protein n=1 Tax=Nocardioides caricicola TaxID=634770 RepID=A0ABW0N773_9ACTN
MAQDARRGPEDLFRGHPAGLAICRRVEEVVNGWGDATVTTTKSQVGFHHGRGFAYVWRPGQYVDSDVPAVVSFALPREVVSPRLKSVAHPAPTTWMHHVEIRDIDEIDDELCAWLAEAYDAAAR